MDTQIEYIRNLAIQYKKYMNDPESLYKDLNELPEVVLTNIMNEYGDPDRRFQPVTIVRAEICRRILNGEKVSQATTELIKEKIRSKDSVFFSHLNDRILKELDEYPLAKRDMFANWQNPWRLYHTFFFRETIRETTNLYLRQIAEQVIKDLELDDYTYHTVDFYGPSNFGDDLCWIAVYPLQKNSHQDAYQFCIAIRDKLEAGRIAGAAVRDKEPNQVVEAKNYSDILAIFKKQKEQVIQLNNSIRNYFKYSPGEQASEWPRFREEGVAGLYMRDIKVGDLTSVNARKELNIKAGLDADNESNQTWNLWLLKTANIGDVVFASKGVSTCIGIGIIEGEYYYDKNEQEL